VPLFLLNWLNTVTSFVPIVGNRPHIITQKVSTIRYPITTTSTDVSTVPCSYVCWLSKSNDDNGGGSESSDTLVAAALPAAASVADTDEINTISNIEPSTSGGATTAVMISQNQKRMLVEELGYRRKDVDKLRFELASPIIEKRIRCPDTGMPREWFRSEKELSMMEQQLLQESKYPLKVPLLGISLILFGKGFGDALITLIKVNIDFPGASLTEQFMGVPVLAVDIICSGLGGALGAWTWNTMRD
jgi:hypothetical protein